MVYNQVFRLALELFARSQLIALPSRQAVQIVRQESKPRPRFIPPMECRAVQRLPKGEQWVYEVKEDGYRVEAVIDGSTVVLHSMAGLNFNDRFPLLVQSLKWLKLQSAVLDGEIVALDEGESFSNLHQDALFCR